VAGVELDVDAAVVLTAPPNNEPAGFGCSAGLLKLKRLPGCAGCDEAAGAFDAAGAGVMG
jgi:hypothetical protein